MDLQAFPDTFLAAIFEKLDGNTVFTGILVLVTIYYAYQTRQQANAMDIQNRMTLDGLRLDRLAKQRERLDREMTKIVGPIHSRKDEKLLFDPYTASNSRIQDRIGYIPFWQGIEENMHLIPRTDRKYLDNFIYIRKFYYEVQDKTSSEEAKNQFDKHKGALIDIMDLRYNQLIEEIQRLDRELGWIK